MGAIQHYVLSQQVVVSPLPHTTLLSAHHLHEAAIETDLRSQKVSREGLGVVKNISVACAPMFTGIQFVEASLVMEQCGLLHRHKKRGILIGITAN